MGTDTPVSYGTGTLEKTVDTLTAPESLTSAAGRKQFSLGQDSVQRLAALKEETHAGSASEVIRNALRVYDYLVQEEKKGHALLVDQGNERYVQLKIL